MPEIKIVTDSTANLSPEFVEEHSIKVVPLNIHWGEETSKDGVDITPQQFYARLEKWAEARKSYEKAIELDPFDLEAHQRMGDLAKARGEMDRAADAYGILVMLDPDNLARRHQRALVLVAAGQTWQAVNDYEEILAKDENNLEALIRLGNLYLSLGQKDPARRPEFYKKAKTSLKQAQELAPDNQAIEEMLSKLEE